MNQIKLNKFRLNKRQKKYTKPIQFDERNQSKQIYIKNQCKQIHTCKVVGRRREEQKKKKNHIVGIYYELFEIYTLYIEEVDMNKKSNAGLICEIMNYRKKR